MQPALEPPLYDYARLAHDPIRGRTLLNNSFAPSLASHTWEWDGSQWIQLSPTIVPTGAATAS